MFRIFAFGAVVTMITGVEVQAQSGTDAYPKIVGVSQVKDDVYQLMYRVVVDRLLEPYEAKAIGERAIAEGGNRMSVGVKFVINNMPGGPLYDHYAFVGKADGRDNFSMNGPTRTEMSNLAGTYRVPSGEIEKGLYFDAHWQRGLVVLTEQSGNLYFRHVHGTKRWLLSGGLARPSGQWHECLQSEENGRVAKSNGSDDSRCAVMLASNGSLHIYRPEQVDGPLLEKPLSIAWPTRLEMLGGCTGGCPSGAVRHCVFRCWIGRR